MSLGSISGLEQQTLNRIYSRNGNGEYHILQQKRQYELEKLSKQLEKEEISESEYEVKKEELLSVPHVLYQRDENNPSSAISSSKLTTTKPSDSQREIGGNTKRLEKEDIERRETIEKLKQKYAAGQISEFEYKSNMFLLTTPVNTEQTTGQHLSILA